MLAGSTRRSAFSPASTWPLAASSSTHDLDCLGAGAAGTGRLSLSDAAGAAGCGAGAWAAAKPTAEVNRAASKARRAVWVTFIDNVTPGESPGESTPGESAPGASEMERRRVEWKGS